VAVLLLYLSAFATGYFNSSLPVGGGQAPPWRSGQISARDLGRAGVWSLLVFTVAEFLVFIVMTDLRKRGELLEYWQTSWAKNVALDERSQKLVSKARGKEPLQEYLAAVSPPLLNGNRQLCTRPF